MIAGPAAARCFSLVGSWVVFVFVKVEGVFTLARSVAVEIMIGLFGETRGRPVGRWGGHSQYGWFLQWALVCLEMYQYVATGSIGVKRSRL